MTSAALAVPPLLRTPVQSSELLHCTSDTPREAQTNPETGLAKEANIEQ